ncbi:MAG TPA: transcription antitermination factor NusB [Dehalococcoidia bacterium]|nr:transcription antitermination factor NusB [Dehalococcoidia bacterium]
MAGARRKARALVLQGLYEIDSARRNPEEVLTRLLSNKRLSVDNATFIRELVEGVIRNRDELDMNIKRFAPAWPIEQLSLLDRNILRLAIFELLLNNRAPVKVVINEAVELAKNFGSENSARFVNGVLSSVSNLAAGQQKGR